MARSSFIFLFSTASKTIMCTSKFLDFRFLDMIMYARTFQLKNAYQSTYYSTCKNLPLACNKTKLHILQSEFKKVGPPSL